MLGYSIINLYLKCRSRVDLICMTLRTPMSVSKLYGTETFVNYKGNCVIRLGNNIDILK